MLGSKLTRTPSPLDEHINIFMTKYCRFFRKSSFWTYL